MAHCNGSPRERPEGRRARIAGLSGSWRWGEPAANPSQAAKVPGTGKFAGNLSRSRLWCRPGGACKSLSVRGFSGIQPRKAGAAGRERIRERAGKAAGKILLEQTDRLHCEQQFRHGRLKPPPGCKCDPVPCRERQQCSGCGPSQPAAELTIWDTLQSLGPARDLAASGRYRGTADFTGDRVCAVMKSAARPTLNIVKVRSNDRSCSARLVTVEPLKSLVPLPCCGRSRRRMVSRAGV
jgi:hypothetical protein